MIKQKQNQGHCIKLMLAAGANVSPRNEAHGLEGFGSGSNVRPASWCAGLTTFKHLLQ